MNWRKMTTPEDEQGEARLAEVAGGEHALDHELVGAVRGHGEERSAEDAGPEGVGLGEVEGEVEACGTCRRRRRRRGCGASRRGRGSRG